MLPLVTIKVSVTGTLPPLATHGIFRISEMAFAGMILPISVSLGPDSVRGRRPALVQCLFHVPPTPSMHLQESRSCSGYRLSSQQLQAQVALLRPGAMV